MNKDSNDYYTHKSMWIKLKREEIRLRELGISPIQSPSPSQNPSPIQTPSPSFSHEKFVEVCNFCGQKSDNKMILPVIGFVVTCSRTCFMKSQ